jgi:hypothetical protein
LAQLLKANRLTRNLNRVPPGLLSSKGVTILQALRSGRSLRTREVTNPGSLPANDQTRLEDPGPLGHTKNLIGMTLVKSRPLKENGQTPTSLKSPQPAYVVSAHIKSVRRNKKTR